MTPAAFSKDGARAADGERVFGPVDGRPREGAREPMVGVPRSLRIITVASALAIAIAIGAGTSWTPDPPAAAPLYAVVSSTSLVTSDWGVTTDGSLASRTAETSAPMPMLEPKPVFLPLAHLYPDAYGGHIVDLGMSSTRGREGRAEVLPVGTDRVFAVYDYEGFG